MPNVRSTIPEERGRALGCHVRGHGGLAAGDARHHGQASVDNWTSLSRGRAGPLSRGLRLITQDGAERRSPGRDQGLLDGPGLLWIDVRYWDADTASSWRSTGLHQRAVRDCAAGSLVPKVHVYLGPDLPGAARAGAGRGWPRALHRARPVRRAELAAHGTGRWTPRYRSTRHTSRPVRSPEAGQRGCAPTGPASCRGAVVTVLIGRLREFLTALTEEVWNLERQVTAGHVGTWSSSSKSCSGCATACSQRAP